MKIEVALRLGRGLNDRMHWRTRNRQKKAEQEAIGWAVAGKAPPPVDSRLVVTITRVAPGNGLDDDNLVTSCKAVRDSLAKWLGVDDKHADRVTYRCLNARGPWAVRISIEPGEPTTRPHDPPPHHSL